MYLPIFVKGKHVKAGAVFYFSGEPGKKLTECQRRYDDAIRRYTSHAMIPQCRPDGSFLPRQCDMSYCFCVDENGDERSNTRLNVRYGKPLCDETGGYPAYD